MTAPLRAASGSSAENLFISLFEDVFGAEKTGYLYSQYPFYDIYQDSRFADFLLENGGKRIAIEIDDDASHLPGHVSQVKHYDDLTKQNSMIHMGWAVYRWPVRIMQEQPDRVKDELRIFLGSLFAGSPSTLIYSAAGGLTAYLVMCLLISTMKDERLWLLSALSAIGHNAGQLGACAVILKTPSIFVYAPVLAISGVITGVFTGLAAMYLVRAVRKLHL